MLRDQPDLRVRRYGPLGRSAVVLHGGPGAAPGSAGALARALAGPLHVLEPWQRRSSGVPLTVDRHVEDLAGVISRDIPGDKPALVGVSWGAMLALVFTSRYSDPVSAIVLIGCGTFDRQARDRLRDTLAQRTSPELKVDLEPAGSATGSKSSSRTRKEFVRGLDRFSRIEWTLAEVGPIFRLRRSDFRCERVILARLANFRSSAKAISVLLKQVGKQKFAETSAPRSTTASESQSRHIPAAIRRAVWQRDAGRCTYVSAGGRRCNSNEFVEFDHAEAWTWTRAHPIDGITLRCRAHNQLRARIDFGEQHMPRFRRTGFRSSSPTSNDERV